MKFAASYFGNRTLRHVRRDLLQLRREGFSIVVHTFSENDLRYYRNTIRDIVATSVDIGLEVWIDPWGVGGVFGGEAFSRVALRERSWLQTGADGSRLPACCPNNPAFRDFLEEWFDAACATDARMVFFDEPHFYSDESGQSAGCRCRHCQAVGERLESDLDPAVRTRSLVEFLDWGCAQVKLRGKKSAICLVPESVGKTGGAAWEALSRADGLENLGTVPFWALRGEEVRSCLAGIGAEAVARASKAGLKSHLWIQGFQIPAGREGEITDAVVAAAGTGTDVIAVWSFEACAAMSLLACERPGQAWRAFLEGMSLVQSD